MSKKSEILEKLEAIKEGLEVDIKKDGEDLSKEDPYFRTEDIAYQFGYLFSEDTEAALSKKSENLKFNYEINMYRFTDETGTYQLLRLGVRVKISDQLNGAKAIIEDLNKLAGKGLIHSALIKFSMITDTVSSDPNLRASTIFSFILVPLDRLEEAKNSVSYEILPDRCAKWLLPTTEIL